MPSHHVRGDINKLVVLSVQYFLQFRRESMTVLTSYNVKEILVQCEIVFKDTNFVFNGWIIFKIDRELTFITYLIKLILSLCSPFMTIHLVIQRK